MPNFSLRPYFSLKLYVYVLIIDIDNDFEGLHDRLPEKNFAFGELKKLYSGPFFNLKL